MQLDGKVCDALKPRHLKWLAALALAPGEVLRKVDVKRGLGRLSLDRVPMVPASGKIRAEIGDPLKDWATQQGDVDLANRVDLMLRVVSGEGIVLDLPPEKVQVVDPNGTRMNPPVVSPVVPAHGPPIAQTTPAAGPIPVGGLPPAVLPTPCGPVVSKRGDVVLSIEVSTLPTRMELRAAVTNVHPSRASRPIRPPPWKIQVPGGQMLRLEAIEGDPILHPEVDELHDIRFEAPMEAIRLNSALVVCVRDIAAALPAVVAQAIADYLESL